MFQHIHMEKPYFYGVALSIIVFGAGIAAIGAVEWLMNYYAGLGFVEPINKVIGGAIILSLGYIHLELEMMRLHEPKK